MDTKTEKSIFDISKDGETMTTTEEITKARSRVTPSTPAQFPEYHPHSKHTNTNEEQRKKGKLNQIRRQSINTHQQTRRPDKELLREGKKDIILKHKRFLDHFGSAKVFFNNSHVF